MATVRYFVKDVETSVKFYTEFFDFKVQQQFPAIAILSKDDLTLWLAGPISSAAQPMPDGTKPQPGGWNRFVIDVKNISEVVSKLRSQGMPFRNEILKGPGGSQILCVDPSGNVIELFERA